MLSNFVNLLFPNSLIIKYIVNKIITFNAGCSECSPCSNSTTSEANTYATTQVTTNSQSPLRVTSVTKANEPQGKKKICFLKKNDIHIFTGCELTSSFI